MAINLGAAVNEGTIRRLATFVISFAIIALNKKLGLHLDDVAIGGLTTLSVGYILQSAAKEAHEIRSEAIAAGSTAAAQVTDLDAAAKSLSTPVQR